MMAIKLIKINCINILNKDKNKKIEANLYIFNSKNIKYINMTHHPYS